MLITLTQIWNKSLFSIVLILVSSNVAGQLPHIVPLPPNAAAFAKSGDYKVGPISGRPEISFPIYTVESGNLKLPISLSYLASGIQVNQLSSWVGLGWSLNAGGIISRSVRGIPDDVSLYGWYADKMSSDDLAHSSDYPLLKSYADLVRDSYPDFFSYNFGSKGGKFVFRKTTQKFETIPFEPVDIFLQNGSAESNHFRITDNDGTKYFFEYKKKYLKLDATIGTPQSLRNYVQSWYLTKMISANGTDTISLKYELKNTSAPGVDTEWWLIQKRYQRIYSKNRPELTAYTDEGSTETTTIHTGIEPVLTEISFRNGKVILHSNTGRKDYPGPMLDSITVLNKQKTIKKVKFNYGYFAAAQPQFQNDYRLKLISFSNTEMDKNLDEDVHAFEYQESIKLPSTASTAQDFWGYYNGRDQAFLPNKPPGHADLHSPFFQNNLWMGIADRTVDDTYLKAGMLSKVIYPTKGYTIFNFESNKYKSEFTNVVHNVSLASTRVDGIAKNIPVTKTIDFVWSSEYQNNAVKIDIFFSASKGPGPFVLEDVQKIQLLDVTAGRTIERWSHITNIYYPQQHNSIIYGFIPGHRYRLIASVQDESTPTPTYLTVSLTATKISQESFLKSGGGLRVSEISSYEPSNSLIKKETYTYNSRSGEGLGIFLRSDKSFEENYFTKKTWVVDPDCSKTRPPCECLFYQKNEIIYVGEGTYPQVTLQGAAVIYDSVTKTVSDQQGNINGKTVYNQAQTIPSNTSIYHPNVPGEREYINNIISAGGIPSESHYSYNKSTRKFELVKQKLFDYSLQHIESEPMTAVYRRIFFPELCPSGYTQGISDLTHMQYRLNLGVYKLRSFTERDYDLSGNLTVENVNNYFYDNQNHMEVTRIELINSDKSIYEESFKFPDDFTDNSYGGNLLRAKSIKTTPLEITTMRNNTVLKKQTNTYSQYLGNVWLEKLETTLGTAQPDVIRYDKYDFRGNPLEIHRVGPANTTFKQAYVWGYNSSYPVMEIKNAGYGDAFISNFEDGDGNSSVKDAHTGNYSKVGGFARSLSGLNNGTYILSYWAKTLDRWNLITQNVQVSSGSYAINISGQIDDILFYPKTAVVSTFTYNPLVGVSSQTDVKGMTTYYDYDGLQRLKSVKDQNGSAVKTHEYHYKP